MFQPTLPQISNHSVQALGQRRENHFWLFIQQGVIGILVATNPRSPDSTRGWSCPLVEWATISNAAERSNKISSAELPCSNHSLRSYRRAIRAVSVPNSGLNPDWNGSSAEDSSQKTWSYSVTTLTIIFPRNGKFDILNKVTAMTPHDYSSNSLSHNLTITGNSVFTNKMFANGSSFVAMSISSQAENPTWLRRQSENTQYISNLI